MIAHHYIGHSKTALKDVRRGIPKHEAGNIDNAYDSLRKKGFFLYEIRKREPYFSINPKIVPYTNDLIRYNRCPLCYYYLEDLEYCRECGKDLSKIREQIKD